MSAKPVPNNLHDGDGPERKTEYQKMGAELGCGIGDLLDQAEAVTETVWALLQVDDDETVTRDTLANALWGSLTLIRQANKMVDVLPGERPADSTH